MIPFLRDPLRASVEIATGGYCTVLYDALKNPHVMRVIPKFRYEDIGASGVLGTGTCTAFVVNDTTVDELFVGQYHALAVNGELATMPRRTSRTAMHYNAGIDAARTAAAALGRGWHVQTCHEWAAVALWTKANGTWPDLDVDDIGAIKATPFGAANGWEWGFSQRHDRSPAGLADQHMTEVTDLINLREGRIWCTPNNAWMTAEGDWTAQAAYFDSLTTGGSLGAGSQGTPILAAARTTAAWTDGTQDGPYNTDNWQNITIDGGYASNQLLMRLLVEPSAAHHNWPAFIRNYGERIVTRSGGAARALGFLSAAERRSAVRTYRLAFVA